jgi:hypothetical protein
VAKTVLIDNSGVCLDNLSTKEVLAQNIDQVSHDLSNLFDIRGHYKLLIYELKVWLISTWKLMSTWILQNPNPSS